MPLLSGGGRNLVRLLLQLRWVPQGATRLFSKQAAKRNYLGFSLCWYIAFFVFGVYTRVVVVFYSGFRFFFGVPRLKKTFRYEWYYVTLQVQTACLARQ